MCGVCGAVSFCPLSLVLLLLSFLSFPLFCAILLSGGRVNEDAANEPTPSLDFKRHAKSKWNSGTTKGLGRQIGKG